jgi:hypothetical protein
MTLGRRPPPHFPMPTAPRDGTLVRLWLRDGGDFVGLYSDKWWGWVAFFEIECPLIRGDIAFAGWQPVADAPAKHPGLVESESPMLTSATRQKRPPTIIGTVHRAAAAAANIPSPIVHAKRPRP